MAPSHNARIIVCDGDIEFRRSLVEYLVLRDFDVRAAANAIELRAVLGKFAADLIVLDNNLPGESGLSVLRSIEAKPAPSAILLSGLGDINDRILGLELGADDYLTKPVDFRELTARMKAVLRRKSEALAKTNEPDGRTRFPFGSNWLDLDAAKLFSNSGEEIPLTAMEFNLLRLFSRNRGRALNRDQILEGAHDRPWDPYDRSIDIRISRLRRKIEANPDKPEVLRTVRGIGYIYDPPVS